MGNVFIWGLRLADFPHGNTIWNPVEFTFVQTVGHHMRVRILQVGNNDIRIAVCPVLDPLQKAYDRMASRISAYIEQSQRPDIAKHESQLYSTRPGNLYSSKITAKRRNVLQQ